MGFDDEFDEQEFDEQEFDEDLEDLDEEIEEDMEEDIKEPFTEIEKKEVESKTPSKKIIHGGKKISVYFMSTIGPGEKKQKLTINDGNLVGEIKETVANLFGLDPADFYLSSGGVTMDENSILRDFNVSDGDDILLIPASIAG
ncbi:MAG: ubiquitin-like domain-containing protein [Promethearchaeota archaeon]